MRVTLLNCKHRQCVPLIHIFSYSLNSTFFSFQFFFFVAWIVCRLNICGMRSWNNNNRTLKHISSVPHKSSNYMCTILLFIVFLIRSVRTNRSVRMSELNPVLNSKFFANPHKKANVKCLIPNGESSQHNSKPNIFSTTFSPQIINDQTSNRYDANTSHH